MDDPRPPAPSGEPAQAAPTEAPPGRGALRRRLQAERLAIADRSERDRRIGGALAAWLADRPERVVGGYWPIRGEFDPLPVLARWAGADPGRRIGLPVVDAATKTMRFRAWEPGAPMGEDAYGIPEPVGTPEVSPELLVVPCVGFGPGALRLGYGGGFFDRMLAAADPRPATIGIAYALAFVPDLLPGPFDIPLDLVMTEDGIAVVRAD